eukprot:Rmarinus@m.6124
MTDSGWSGDSSWATFYALLADTRGLRLRVPIPDTIVVCDGTIINWIYTKDGCVCSKSPSECSLLEVQRNFLQKPEHKFICVEKRGRARLLRREAFLKLIERLKWLSSREIPEEGSAAPPDYLILQRYKKPRADLRYVTTLVQEQYELVCRSYGCNYSRRYHENVPYQMDLQEKLENDTMVNVSTDTHNKLRTNTVSLFEFLSKAHNIWLNGIVAEYIKDEKEDRFYLHNILSASWTEHSASNPAQSSDLHSVSARTYSLGAPGAPQFMGRAVPGASVTDRQPTMAWDMTPSPQPSRPGLRSHSPRRDTSVAGAAAAVRAQAAMDAARIDASTFPQPPDCPPPHASIEVEDLHDTDDALAYREREHASAHSPINQTFTHTHARPPTQPLRDPHTEHATGSADTFASHPPRGHPYPPASDKAPDSTSSAVMFSSGHAAPASTPAPTAGSTPGRPSAPPAARPTTSDSEGGHPGGPGAAFGGVGQKRRYSPAQRPASARPATATTEWETASAKSRPRSAGSRGVTIGYEPAHTHSSGGGGAGESRLTRPPMSARSSRASPALGGAASMAAAKTAGASAAAADFLHRRPMARQCRPPMAIQLTQDLEMCKAELLVAYDRIAELESRNEALKRENEVVQIKLQDTMDTFAHSMSSIDEQLRRVTQSEAELTAKNKELAHDLEELKREYEAVRKERDDLRDEARGEREFTVRALKESHDSMREAKEKELVMREDLAQMAARWQKEIDTLTRERDELESRMRDVKSINEFKEKELVETRGKVVDLMKKEKNARDKIRLITRAKAARARNEERKVDVQDLFPASANLHDELEELYSILYLHRAELRLVFNAYAVTYSNGDLRVKMTEFWKLVEDCDLKDANVTRDEVDRVFIRACWSRLPTGQPIFKAPEKAMQFHEFLEGLVRLAAKKFYMEKNIPTAVSTLLQKVLLFGKRFSLTIDKKKLKQKKRGVKDNTSKKKDDQDEEPRKNQWMTHPVVPSHPI